MFTVTKVLQTIETKNEEHIVEKPKISPYDERLSTCKEPRFMKYVRNWEKKQGFVTPILWKNTFWITAFHLAFIFSWVYAFTVEFITWQSFLFACLFGIASGVGVTAGAHRYWTHRSYKAKWPLRVILFILFAMSGQNTIYEWVRDHRVHHKFSETSADPHNAKRGFFFSHVGWLMMKRHPDVLREWKKMDMSDIEQDPLARFHTKYFEIMRIICSWVVPTLITWLAFGETLFLSVLTQVFMRYVITLNVTWTVNSFAHMWGNKPYNPNIMASENWFVAIISQGEGWHNYHHTFPWDYKIAEYGISNNFTKNFLDFCGKIGWAYDFKEASPELVKAVLRRQQKKSAFDD